jgi:hypothetical protein
MHYGNGHGHGHGHEILWDRRITPYSKVLSGDIEGRRKVASKLENGLPILPFLGAIFSLRQVCFLEITGKFSIFRYPA